MTVPSYAAAAAVVAIVQVVLLTVAVAVIRQFWTCYLECCHATSVSLSTSLGTVDLLASGCWCVVLQMVAWYCTCKFRIIHKLVHHPSFDVGRSS